MSTEQATPARRVQPRPGRARRFRPGRPVGLFLVATTVLIVLSLVSIAVGSRQIPLDQVVQALLDRAGMRGTDPQVEAIVWGVRLPRTLLGLLVGMALGLSGALMQGLTRNPLADPGLLGVSAGAALGIVIAIAWFGIATLYGYIWFAFVGALVASIVVYLLGGLGRGGSTPVKVALAGVAITFLLNSVTSAVVLRDPEALNRYRFWAAGSLSGPGTETVLQLLPFLAVGIVLALATAPALNSLALGDDVAAALGRRVGLVRLQGTLAVTLLAGAAVAVAGSIVFVGLMVPHVARLITGPNHRWLLPFTMVLAPSLLLLADVIGRVIARPSEVGVGIISAFIGGPFFIALVRRRRLAEL
ncbi:FecCD family ABC transporter permease [Plantactinospora soyae]|uniref:Iron complex transport system permease protein n=1 Tax=Plantactinospora soyae TaxID=1544732 RepID=A0A927M8M8_9ACTN|nr:iron chelate uptake ABC transporter family permease subunit [Plantactinospora soyae]MBE1490012.1 iron complex transport system permease protein [Plantactinospora soyae]